MKIPKRDSSKNSRLFASDSATKPTVSCPKSMKKRNSLDLKSRCVASYPMKSPHHQRTRKERDAAREQLRLTQSDLNRETLAHRACLDSLNTERSLHASTQNRLRREEAQNAKNRETLRNTQQKLDRANEQLNVQNRQIKALRSDLKRAQDNADNARQTASRLLQQSDDHQRALLILQATVDSLFLKEFKRPRVPSEK